jgi:haloalkane dehalogenase
VDVFRTPDERFSDLLDFPFAPRYAEQDGLRLHYLDEGDERGKPVLLLHGEPSWSFLYRRVVPPLVRAGRRAIVPDLFGFGRSDKPLDSDWYTYDAHYRTIERLVVEQLDLRALTLVVHDWGGPIGMRLAVEHDDRVDYLVVTNTGIGAGRAPSKTWLRFREVVRELGGALEIARLMQSGCVRALSDDVLRGYDAPFPTPESKVGALMFPELVPTEPEHPNTAPMLAVRERMECWTKPTLVLFGDSDPIFPPRAAERMAELIPGAAPAELIEKASHFLHEDAGEEVAARLLKWQASASTTTSRSRS